MWCLNFFFLSARSSGGGAGFLVFSRPDYLAFPSGWNWVRSRDKEAGVGGLWDDAMTVTRLVADARKDQSEEERGKEGR